MAIMLAVRFNPFLNINITHYLPWLMITHIYFFFRKLNKIYHNGKFYLHKKSYVEGNYIV